MVMRNVNVQRELPKLVKFIRSVRIHRTFDNKRKNTSSRYLKISIGWDEELKGELMPKFKSLLEQILKIPDAVIPRCFVSEIFSCVDL